MNFCEEEQLTPAQGGWVSDTLTLEEAWARFPLAMERANLGIGHLMTRPGFMLRLWNDDQTMIAQARMTEREREGCILRALLRRRSWPLLIDGVTHGMDRLRGGKRVSSWCGIHRVVKKTQRWLESRDRDVDCMSCLASGNSMEPVHSRDKLEAMRWTATVTWMPYPGIWSRFGSSISSHPRNEPGRFVGEDEIPVAIGAAD